jgi:hypothetical protein
MSAAAAPKRACKDCGQAADFAVRDEAGGVHGWLCDKCEWKHRRRRLGLWRRVRHRVMTILGG